MVELSDLEAALVREYKGYTIDDIEQYHNHVMSMGDQMILMQFAREEATTGKYDSDQIADDLAKVSSILYWAGCRFIREVLHQEPKFIDISKDLEK
jgi:hypothetical protein